MEFVCLAAILFAFVQGLYRKIEVMKKRNLVQDKLDLFHELVAAQRYREARGILETEGDIPPDVAQKWLDWLDALHYEERLKAGVGLDAKKQDPDRAAAQMARGTGGIIFIIIAALLLWLIIIDVFTYETTSEFKGFMFLAVSFGVGYMGWEWVGHLFDENHKAAIGGIAAAIFIIYLLTSGFPMWYYYEPPLKYLLAAFALMLPGTAFVAFRVGELVGLGSLRLYRRFFSSEYDLS